MDSASTGTKALRLVGSELSLFSPIVERCIILSGGEHPESKTASFDRANRRRHCSDFPIDTRRRNRTARHTIPCHPEDLF